MVGYPLNLAEKCWALEMRTPEAIDAMFKRVKELEEKSKRDDKWADDAMKDILRYADGEEKANKKVKELEKKIKEMEERDQLALKLSMEQNERFMDELEAKEKEIEEQKRKKKVWKRSRSDLVSLWEPITDKIMEICFPSYSTYGFAEDYDGSECPTITHETISEFMEKVDKWEEDSEDKIVDFKDFAMEVHNLYYNTNYDDEDIATSFDLRSIVFELNEEIREHRWMMGKLEELGGVYDEIGDMDDVGDYIKTLTDKIKEMERRDQLALKLSMEQNERFMDDLEAKDKEIETLTKKNERLSKNIENARPLMKEVCKWSGSENAMEQLDRDIGVDRCVIIEYMEHLERASSIYEDYNNGEIMDYENWVEKVNDEGDYICEHSDWVIKSRVFDLVCAMMFDYDPKARPRHQIAPPSPVLIAYGDSETRSLYYDEVGDEYWGKIRVFLNKMYRGANIASYNGRR